MGLELRALRRLCLISRVLKMSFDARDRIGFSSILGSFAVGFGDAVEGF